MFEEIENEPIFKNFNKETNEFRSLLKNKFTKEKNYLYLIKLGNI